MLPVVVVAGLGRCGSSLVMQMLRAGGMACIGVPPAFEDMRVVAHGPIDPAWFGTLGGRAVKVLDPHLNLLPKEALAVVVWLDRDRHEQARSQVKFLKLMTGLPVTPDYESACAESLALEKPQALRCVSRWPLLRLAFEDVLANPLRAAGRVAAHVGGDLNISAMAAVVRPRNPSCAPGLDMEMALIAEETGRC